MKNFNISMDSRSFDIWQISCPASTFPLHPFDVEIYAGVEKQYSEIRGFLSHLCARSTQPVIRKRTKEILVSLACLF